MTTFEGHPNESEDRYQRLCSRTGVEHVCKQYDDTVVIYGTAPESSPIEWLQEEMELEHVTDIDFELIKRTSGFNNLTKESFRYPAKCVIIL